MKFDHQAYNIRMGKESGSFGILGGIKERFRSVFHQTIRQETPTPAKCQEEHEHGPGYLSSAGHVDYYLGSYTKEQLDRMIESTGARIMTERAKQSGLYGGYTPEPTRGKPNRYETPEDQS